MILLFFFEKKTVSRCSGRPVSCAVHVLLCSWLFPHICRVHSSKDKIHGISGESPYLLMAPRFRGHNMCCLHKTETMSYAVDNGFSLSDSKVLVLYMLVVYTFFFNLLVSFLGRRVYAFFSGGEDVLFLVENRGCVFCQAILRCLLCLSSRLPRIRHVLWLKTFELHASTYCELLQKMRILRCDSFQTMNLSSTGD